MDFPSCYKKTLFLIYQSSNKHKHSQKKKILQFQNENIFLKCQEKYFHFESGVFCRFLWKKKTPKN